MSDVQAARPSVPAIDLKDLGLLGLLPPLALVAWLTPEPAWPEVARRLARLRLALRGGRTASEITKVAAALGDRAVGLPAGECWRAHLAHNYAAWLQLLGCYRPRGLRAAIRLEGAAHLEAALDAGRGGILWVAPFAFSDLITKVALHRAGYRVSHLSRDTHGFSSTRFGKQVLNPIRTHVERRYLAERLVMTTANPVRALRALSARLKENRLISITVAATGQRSRLLPFLDGEIRIATGALGLAWQTGAPVLPVFTLKEPEGGFCTRIEPPLAPPPGELGREAAIDALLARYVPLLEAYVLRRPDQFSLPYLSADPRPERAKSKP